MTHAQRWFLLAMLSYAVTAWWATNNERNQIDCARAGLVWRRGIVSDYCEQPR